jgi:hypothetical protein
MDRRLGSLAEWELQLPTEPIRAGCHVAKSQKVLAEELIKKHGKTSDFRGQSAKLPPCQPESGGTSWHELTRLPFWEGNFLKKPTETIHFKVLYRSGKT